MGAYRETRGFKEETPASEMQVEGERNPSAAQPPISARVSEFFDPVRTTEAPSIPETTAAAEDLHHILSF